MAILNPKIEGSNTLWDAFEMGLFKSLGEQVLTPIIGNSTPMSGAIKMVGGTALNAGTKNKHLSLLSSGLVIDGVDDVVQSVIMPLIGGGLGGSTAGNVGGDVNSTSSW